MNKIDFAGLFNSMQTTIIRRSPEILTGIGIAGMITTTVLAVSKTPKALKLIEQEKKKQRTDKLTTVDTVKACWKCYIPPVLLGTASVACLIGASSVNFKRNAALATAYKLSETALTEYREKVVETIGEKKEKEVREKVAESRLEKNPINDTNVFITGKGNTLFMEPITGQYIRSDMDSVKRSVNELNEKLLRDPFGYLSLNDLLIELGFETSSKGDDIGWNVSSGIVKMDYYAKLTKDEEPCIVIDYVNAPQYGYSRFM